METMKYIIIHLSNIIQLTALSVFTVVLHEYFGLPQYVSIILIAIPSGRIVIESVELTDAYRRARRMAEKRKRDEEILDA